VAVAVGATVSIGGVGHHRCHGHRYLTNMSVCVHRNWFACLTFIFLLFVFRRRRRRCFEIIRGKLFGERKRVFFLSLINNCSWFTFLRNCVFLIFFTGVGTTQISLWFHFLHFLSLSLQSKSDSL